MNCCCYISINQHKIKIFGYPIKKIYRLVEKHLQATQPSKSNMTHPKPTYQLRRVGIKYAIASKSPPNIHRHMMTMTNTKTYKMTKTKTKTQTNTDTKCLPPFDKST